MAATVMGIRCRWEGGVAKDDRTDFANSIFYFSFWGCFFGGRGGWGETKLEVCFVLVEKSG